MTNEQARKLLGGYATNSLTEAERKALFEAALDDQELFDALQQEEALKELLADPVSRHQVQQALAQQSGPERATSWSRWWAFGAVAGALATAVLVIAVVRLNQRAEYPIASALKPVPQADTSALQAPPPTSPMQEAKPKPPEPAPPKAVGTARVLREPSARTTTRAPENAITAPPLAGLPLAPPPSSPREAAAPMQTADQLRSQEAVQAQGGQQAATFRQQQYARDSERSAVTRPAAPIQGVLAGAGGFVPNTRSPLLRYSLVTRDASGSYSPLAPGAPPRSGDAVRITVVPAVAGYLSLYQLDPAGAWKRMVPETEPGLPASANVTQTIPDAPIIVKDTEQKFRLMLVPLTPQAELAKDTGERKKSTTATQGNSATAPVVTDITIAAGKLP